MTQADLEKEVEALIVSRIEKKEPSPTGWVTHTIVGNHREIEGADKDWYLLNAYENVRNTALRVARRYKGGPETQQEMQFPGYTRLQRAYTVERDGESAIIPTEQLSHEEIKAKIAELEAMAAGCIEHAEELRRYDAERPA